MGDHGVTSPRPSGEDLEMGELLSSMHASNRVLKGKSQLGVGESSSDGKLRLQKTNGCLQKAEI